MSEIEMLNLNYGEITEPFYDVNGPGPDAAAQIVAFLFWLKTNKLVLTNKGQN